MNSCFIRTELTGRPSVNTKSFLSVGVLLVLFSGGFSTSVNARADDAKVNYEADITANTLTIGTGAAFSPRYSGSDQNVLAPIVGIDFETRSGFFASTTYGLGFGNAIGNFDYSAALGYRDGRSEKDEVFSSGSTRLRGMGDIKGSTVALLGIGYMLTKWLSLSVTGEIAVSQRGNGNAFHFGISSPFYTRANDRLSLGVTTSVGDSKYVQTYYGVTAQQAANSGYTAFKPKAGLYEFNTNLSWEHQFDSHWALQATLGATQLLGDAANSPITRRKISPNASAYVTYSY